MLKVIGAGYPRTGTSSLKTALERLGVGPCHHMEELFKHPEQIRSWLDVARNGNRGWDTLFTGYTSACDFPSQHWYKEILAHYPGAKVILTVRDPEAWYVSMVATIWAISRDFPINWVGRYIPVAGGVVRLATQVLWQDEFQGQFRRPGHAVKTFEQHIEDVKASVPPGDLLVFDVRDGWEPLCTFLGVPVPQEPFPRRNDTAEFRKRVLLTKTAAWILLLLPVLAVGVLLSLLAGR